MATGLWPVINYLRDKRYHRRHRAQALGILRTIRDDGAHADNSVRKRSNEYAREVLGWEGYAPWLWVYAAISGTFKEGWIPDNYYGKVVVPARQGVYGHISDHKSVTNLLFDDEAIPDAGYYVNGLFFDRNHEVADLEELKRALFQRSDKTVFKRDGLGRGGGVHVFEEGDLTEERIAGLGNGAFQHHIAQHSFFDSIAPGAVATLRLTTTLSDDGALSLRGCYLRVGRLGETHVRSGRNVRVAVDPQTGRLARLGYLGSWASVETHPDTGFVFEGAEIPAFEACVACVLKLHRKMPYVRCIGWDVAVDRADRVQVMEWNGGHNGINFSEATQGPCFADLGWENLWRT